MLEKTLQLIFSCFLPNSETPSAVLEGKCHLPSGLTSQRWQLNCVIRQSTSLLSKCQKCFLHNNLKIIFYIFYPLTLINLLCS